MRERIKLIIAYIFRGWEDEPNLPHPGLKIIPPFIFEVLSYIIMTGIIFKIVTYLFSLMFTQ